MKKRIRRIRLWASCALTFLTIAAGTSAHASEFNFVLKWFKVDRTRSPHEDTVWAYTAVKLQGTEKSEVFKKLGDFNDGTHNVGDTALSLGPVNVEPDQWVMYTYKLYNYSKDHPEQLKAALSAQADSEFARAEQEIERRKRILNLGVVETGAAAYAAYKTGKELWDQVSAALKGYCDGPLGSAWFVESGDLLEKRTGATRPADATEGTWGPGWTLVQTYHAGIDSPTGCGGNSKYTVGVIVNHSEQTATITNAVVAAGQQDNWRWCRKCDGLFFNGHDTKGRCPAGEEHESAGSENYSMTKDAPAAGQQDNWRWCRKCDGLFFNGHNTKGRCPAGGAHESAGSANYSMTKG